MKQFMIAVAVVGLLAAGASAYPRGTGTGRTSNVTIEPGNTQDFFSATVGTTTAVAVYAKPSGKVDRLLRICNTLAFDLYVGTSSAMTASSPAFGVPHNGCIDTYGPATDYWAIFESGAGSGGPVIGFKQHDSRD